MSNCLKCAPTYDSSKAPTLCKSCRESIRLLSDHSILKHLNNKKDYPKEVEEKLHELELIYLRRKLQLLHIKERLQELRKEA